MNFDNTQTVQSLYIHWPFCPYKCHFCPFVALAGHDSFMPRYHDALKAELEQFAREQVNKVSLSTIFFGGGTPSTYPEKLLLDTFDTLNKEFKIDQDCEISLEVNPGTVDLNKLKLWKQIGINRLSIGVQSLNDKVLSQLNRHQKAQDVLNLLSDASALFENISVDLIIGLPQVSDDEWKDLINKLVEWPIKHVSMYFLTVHEDTPLYFGIKQKKIALPCEDKVVDLYYWTIDNFNQHGFEQYEISNFAKKDYYSRHNSVYWQRKPYKGLGLGACSFDGFSRLQNEKSLLKYLESVEQGKNLTVFYEKLTDKQVWLEILMLGLRQSKGVLLSEVVQPLEPKEKTLFFQAIDDLSQAGLILSHDNNLRLTPAGLSVVNEIIIKLSCF